LDSAIPCGTHRIVLDAHTDALAARLEAHPELSALLERERAQFTGRIAELEQERDRLRASHERLRQELELFKRRLFIAKAERVDTRQLELEYAQKLRELTSSRARWA
jgi:transposase